MNMSVSYKQSNFLKIREVMHLGLIIAYTYIICMYKYAYTNMYT